MKSPKEVLEKLEARDFDALLGLVESGWLDAKETPYHLDSPKQKLELAKDVTAPEPKLAAVKLVERPLPTDPPETPGYG
jgi:hypothetical protein